MQLLSTGRAVPAVVVVLLVILSIAFNVPALAPSAHDRDAAPADDPAPPGAPPPAISPEIPPDVQNPPPDTEGQKAFFDDFSWRTFLALNWPAVDGKRGIADKAKKPGDKSRMVVWETWKEAHELFQPYGAQPSEWDSFEAFFPCQDVARADVGRTKLLVSFSNLGPVLEDFNEQLSATPVGSLVAQNGTYVRYEIRMNKPLYNYVRGNPDDPTTARYLRQNLPDGASLRFPCGSVVVKAAWRQFRLPEEQCLVDRYFHTEGWLVDRQTRKAHKRVMGLVGFHIAHKTPTRPQWVWSTFEHVDNAPDDGEKNLKDSYTFNNPKKPQKGCGVNDLLPPVNAVHPPQPKPEPVQVVRLTPIDAAAQKANGLYHSHPMVQNTVWKNYNLVATQWPTDPSAADKNGKPFPDSKVANVTIETAVQNGSCMACHGFTRHTDFVWMLTVRAYPPKETAAAQALTALRENQKR
jgi:hypothetical protein